MSHVKIEQNNINGDNTATLVLPARDTLGKTINKVFSIMTDEALRPLGKNVGPEEKIKFNNISEDWIEVIKSVTILGEDIEKICNQTDSSWYSSTDLIKYFRLRYVNDFMDAYKKEKITADEALHKMISVTMENFRKNNTIIESHDELVLKYLVAYSFINCGVLEKPCS